MFRSKKDKEEVKKKREKREEEIEQYRKLIGYLIDKKYSDKLQILDVPSIFVRINPELAEEYLIEHGKLVGKFRDGYKWSWPFKSYEEKEVSPEYVPIELYSDFFINNQAKRLRNLVYQVFVQDIEEGFPFIRI